MRPVWKGRPQRTYADQIRIHEDYDESEWTERDISGS